MILDSSALVAIIRREPGHGVLLDALAGTSAAGVGAPTLVEAGIVLSARMGVVGRTLLARVVHDAGLTIVPFSAPHWSVAVDAFGRFGKGRHAAALNFGDCLTYATARIAGQPLLCLGDDFAKTDLELVPIDLPGDF
ncbi:MAG TPA: type II toxin-antitoxin system VapC family toxin [Solirubrobacteraceae bacterium]